LQFFLSRNPLTDSRKTRLIVRELGGSWNGRQ